MSNPMQRPALYSELIPLRTTANLPGAPGSSAALQTEFDALPLQTLIKDSTTGALWFRGGVGTYASGSRLIQLVGGSGGGSFTNVVDITVTDSVTNGITDALIMQHLVTGAALDGIGVGEAFYVENGGGTSVAAGEIAVRFTTVTAGSEAAQAVTSVRGTDGTTFALREVLNLSYTGSGASLVGGLYQSSASNAPQPFIIAAGSAGLNATAGAALSLLGGTGVTVGAGGAVVVRGGTGGVTGTGGTATLQGGTAGGGATAGGNAIVQGGTPTSTGTGGEARLLGGAAVAATGLGGNIRITGGAGNTAGLGGDLIAAAGIGGATGDGGVATFTGGAAGGGTGAGGGATVTGGAGSTSGNGGFARLRGGATATGVGGAASLIGGSASGAGVAGSVELQPGTHVGGTPGAVNLKDAAGTNTLGLQATNVTGTVFALATVLTPAAASIVAGAQTINSIAGRFQCGAGASTFTITCDRVLSADSIVLLSKLSGAADATQFSAQAVAAAGSFVFTANANATAAVNYGFLVINPIA